MGFSIIAFSAISDADTPDKASVTTTAAVEGKGKVNGATATSVGNKTGCFRCAIVALNTKGGGMDGGLYGDFQIRQTGCYLQKQKK